MPVEQIGLQRENPMAHTFVGQHSHPTLGEFTYTAVYATSRPAATWWVNWGAVAEGAGKVLELRGGNIEILVGSAGGAQTIVTAQIHKEIDATT